MRGDKRIAPIVRTTINTLCLIFIAFLCCVTVPPAFGAGTVIVPTDYSTIQDAVQAVQDNADPGEVIINDDGPFLEALYISESVTVRAGTGFSPVIEPLYSNSTPIRIRATEPTATNTAVVLSGLTVQMTGIVGNDTAITIANENNCDPLDVRIDHLTVSGTGIHNAISIAAASINDDISFTLMNSQIEIQAPLYGSPSCVRLEPYGYNLSSTLRKNTFRFSNARAISISGGMDDKLTSTVIDGNVIEGLEGAWTRGIEIRAGGSSGSDASPTNTTITNNLFLRAGAAIEVFTYPSHDHTVYINNNTIVDCGVTPGCDPSGVLEFVSENFCVEVNATVTNNIVVGSKGYGVNVIENDEFGRGGVNLSNDFNLFYNNAYGDYNGPYDAGANDLFEDPLFRNSAQDNYRLSSVSPAIDSGLNTPSGGSGFGEDLDGEPRVLDGDNDTVEIIDRGAYEYLGEIYGCIFLRGEPLVNTDVELVQKGEAKQSTVTNANGCYQFGYVVPDKKFDVKIKGPLVP